MRTFLTLRSLLTCWIASILLLFTASANAETYWLDSRADPNQTRFPNSEEACLTGELQRRLDGYTAASSLPHRIISAYVGPDLGGEVICRGTLQKRQFNTWFGVEIVDVMVYGPNGTAPPCPLGGLADPETGQCGIPKCNNDCPADGGNQSNPIASATGNKRQREPDYLGTGMFPLEFTRYYNSHRVPDNRRLPIGVGWTHSYAARVVPMFVGSSVTRIRVYRPNGAIQTFNLVGSNWVGDADVPERLTATVSSGALVSATYRRADDTVETYNEFGQLTTITSPEGFAQALTYTGGARLLRVTDPQGRTLTFGYSSAGQLVTLTDSAGAIVTFGYSGDDLVSATYPNAISGTNIRTYHYNELGQTGGVSQPHVLTGITDENGNRFASWGYDANRRAVLSVHGPYATGTADRTALQFNGDGSATITDSLGQVRDYAFASSQRVARLTALDAPCDGCANAAAARTYDSNGYPASATDFEGNVTQTTYNTRGLLTQRVEAATDTTGSKRTVQTDWHATFRQPVEHRTYDASGTMVARETLTYNTRGQILTQTRIDPVATISRTVTYAYCEAGGVSGGACPFVGLPVSVDGPRADVTDLTGYTYYQANHSTCASSPTTCLYRKGDLWKVTDALGRVTEFLRYDGNGRPLSIADPNGVITDIEYHPRGWLIAMKVRGLNNSVETDDRITRMAYWPNGRVQRITQPDGAYLDFTYDIAQRLVRIKDSDGGYIAYTLDAAGNRVAEETHDAANILRHSLYRVYNVLGRLETTADASSNPTDYARDGNGNPTTIIDALGRVTSHQYDPLNRLARTVQDVSGIAAQTVTTYDPLDRIIQITDPKGLQTHYTYNALGDLLQLDSPDTGIATYGYDSGGNRTDQTDARGQASAYGYDVLNRVTSATFAGAPTLGVIYQYDTVGSACGSGETFALGRLTGIVDASGSTSYCYERFGQLARKVQVTNGLTFVVRYTYTPSGDLLTLTYPDGTVVDYGRDAQERIAQIGVTGPGASREVLLSGASYAPFGATTGWSYGNGRHLGRSLDLDYRVASVLDAASGGLDAGFAYDAVGNLQRLHDGALASPPRATLDYDNLNRLTAFRDGVTGAPIDAYTYDATGNRTSFASAAGTQAYLYTPGSHRLATIDAAARGYDAVGNTTSIGGTAKSFTYDATNRLSEVKTSGVILRQYAYNGTGERVRSYFGSSSTYSVYDEAGHWLGDYDGSGSPIQQVIWMDDLPVGLLVGASPATGRLHYIQPDHLGTPRAVIEPTRDVAVWTWDLKGEAFGDSAPNEDPDGDSISFTLDMRFPGQRFDAASGLNYNYFRDYETGTGRYIQSDPIGLWGGISSYAYVGSNPLAFTDYLGLAKDQACIAAYAAGGAVCGGVVGYYGGGALGGAGGAIICSPSGPGAAVCAAGGAAGGSILGGAVGAAAGGILGNLAGQAMCPDEDDREKRCNENLERDLATCSVLGRRFGKKEYEVCRQQAMARYGNCLSGRDDGIDAPLPPWDKL